MGSAVSAMTKSILSELDPDGALIPVSSVIESGRYKPLCLLMRKNLNWNPVLEKYQYVTTGFNLTDVMEAGDPGDEIGQFQPLLLGAAEAQKGSEHSLGSPEKTPSSLGMKTARDVEQLLICLVVMCSQKLWAAPLPEFSGEYGYLAGDQGFQQFLSNNLEFSLKIKTNAQQLREVFCQDYKLCNEQELNLVRRQLKISQAPLDQCQSTSFNLDTCFTQIRNGLQTYHADLSTIQKHLSANSVAIDRLKLDISDITSNFQQQMETMSIAVVNFPDSAGQTLNFPTTFHEQAGGYLVLCNLQHFLETVYRALRFLQKQ